MEEKNELGVNGKFVYCPFKIITWPRVLLENVEISSEYEYWLIALRAERINIFMIVIYQMIIKKRKIPITRFWFRKESRKGEKCWNLQKVRYLLRMKLPISPTISLFLSFRSEIIPWYFFEFNSRSWTQNNDLSLFSSFL